MPETLGGKIRSELENCTRAGLVKGARRESRMDHDEGSAGEITTGAGARITLGWMLIWLGGRIDHTYLGVRITKMELGSRAFFVFVLSKPLRPVRPL